MATCPALVRCCRVNPRRPSFYGKGCGYRFAGERRESFRSPLYPVYILRTSSPCRRDASLRRGSLQGHVGLPMLDFAGIALFALTAAPPITQSGIRRFAIGWIVVFGLAIGALTVVNTAQPYLLGRGTREQFPSQAAATAIAKAWASPNPRPPAENRNRKQLAGGSPFRLSSGSPLDCHRRPNVEKPLDFKGAALARRRRADLEAR